MELIGNPDDDRSIVMDLDSFRELFDLPDKVDFIIVQIDEGEDIRSHTELLKKNTQRILVKDTDIGREIQRQIRELSALVQAYRSGELKEFEINHSQIY